MALGVPSLIPCDYFGRRSKFHVLADLMTTADIVAEVLTSMKRATSDERNRHSETPRKKSRKQYILEIIYTYFFFYYTDEERHWYIISNKSTL